MFKKSLVTALLVCTIPAMANAAWFLTTQVKSAGGTLTTSNGAQVVTDGVITKSYTAIADQTPTTALAAGYTLRGLNISDSSVDGTVAVAGPSFTPVDGHTYTVTAAFKVTSLPVTATNTGGTVSPSSVGSIYYGYKLTSPLTFTFAPKAGYSITDVLNVPAGAVKTVPGGVNQRATVSFPVGYVFTSSFNLQAVTVNTTPAINQILPQTVVAGSNTTVSASVVNVTSPVYNWTYVSGPANTATVQNVGGKVSTIVTPGPAIAAFPASAASVTFAAPSVPGQYKFQVKVGSLVKLATVNVVATAADSANQCQFCHTANGMDDSTIGTRYQASIHGQSTHAACSACHYGTANGGHPGSVSGKTVNSSTFLATVDGVVGANGNAVAKGAVYCSSCHNPIPHNTTNLTASCVSCHTSATGVAGTADAHGIQKLSCTGCHAVVQQSPFNSNISLVSDNNNGVRAVTGEFTKWSHHIVNTPGVAVQDEQCAVCHLEGTVGGYGFGVDGTMHMKDQFIHLRNADTDADMQWDPANPNHTTMDNFCMSCHDANGATSAMNGKLQALITPLTGITASPSNPFGDTISNGYDKMMRPAVVNVDSQFNTGNNSHHGVKGPRYTGRTRAVGPRQIAALAAFTANSSANLPGKRTTIFDAGKFNALYAPLENAGGEAAPRTGAASLGDDSTLHCGDCHTVGQWAPNVATNAAGVKNTVAIGAHGSQNDYMLRNSVGTDARHQGIQMDSNSTHQDGVTPYLVCYNCHAMANYGLAAHVGEQVVGENNCNTPTNTNTSNQVGPARLASQNTMTYGTDNPVGVADGATNSNIYGIQCLNCHNDGISAGNIFGGIHGSADPTYTDGAGNTTKHMRFLPGLGNVMYVPGTRGGITGGTLAFVSYSSKIQTSGISKGQRFKGSYSYTTGGVTNDTNWEEKARIPVGDGVTAWSHNPGAAGCYTISAGEDEPYNAEGNGVPGGPAASKGLAAPDGTLLYGNWGGCADHSQSAGSSVRQPRSTNTSIRPVTY